MRLAVGALFVAACGISATGIDPAPGATMPDAGHEASLPPPSNSMPDAAVEASVDADVDAGLSFCAQQRASDPNVVRCVDFEDPALATDPNVGFDEQQEIPANNGTTFGLHTDTAGHSANILLPALGGGATGDGNGRDGRLRFFTNLTTAKKVQLDADVAIDAMQADAAAGVVGFDFGDGCGLFAGIGARYTSSQVYFHRAQDQTFNIVSIAALHAFAHVRIELTPGAGNEWTETNTVNGDTKTVTDTTSMSGCFPHRVSIGFRNTQMDFGTAAFSARFDNVVYRVIP